MNQAIIRVKVQNEKILDGTALMISGNHIYVLLLAASVSFQAFYSLPRAFAADYIYRSYAWDYAGSHWTWTLTIPNSLYSEYNGVSVNERTEGGLAGYGFLVTTQDQYVKQLANALHEAATEKGYGAYDEVSYILSFVQSLLYTSDSVTTGYDEYPRFPVETLVDDGGDCEDTSILFATLAMILDYDAIFINPPNHCAVGVRGNGLPGYYYTYNGRTYYYCETTGDNYAIGDMPPEYEGASAHLYTINESSQYAPYQRTTPPPSPDTMSAPDLLPVLFWLMVIAGLIACVICLSSIAARMQKPKGVALPPPPPPDL